MAKQFGLLDLLDVVEWPRAQAELDALVLAARRLLRETQLEPHGNARNEMIHALCDLIAPGPDDEQEGPENLDSPEPSGTLS